MDATKQNGKCIKAVFKIYAMIQNTVFPHYFRYNQIISVT